RPPPQRHHRRRPSLPPRQPPSTQPRLPRNHHTPTPDHPARRRQGRVSNADSTARRPPSGSLRTVDRDRQNLRRGRRVSRVAGQTQRPKAVALVPRKRGRRPTAAEVEPLFDTYAAVKPDGAWFDEKAADR